MYEFSCYVLDDSDNKAKRVGGSTDQPAAVSIACALYQSMQSDTSVTTPDRGLKIAVFDTATDSVVAMVGVDEE